MYLAWKEMRHSRTRFIMIGIIYVLIAWLVFILSGLGNGLSTLAAATFKNMAADYVVFEQGSKASMTKSLLSGDLAEELMALPKVQSTSPMGIVLSSALKEGGSSDEEKVDIAIIGIEPGSFLEPAVVEGEGLSPERPAFAIANESLKDAGFRVGDVFQLDGSTEKLTIAGFVRNETYNHVASVFVPIGEWRKIAFAAPGSDKGVANPVNAIMLQGKDIDPAAIDDRLPGTMTVTRSAAVQGIPGYKEESGTILMMLGFLLVIGALIVGVFFYVFTMQKTHQFGIMKAIGAKNGYLAKAVVAQVFMLSVAGIGAGILLTYGTAAVMPEGMPFNLDVRLLAFYSLLLLAISLISSLASVRKVLKIDPMKALGRLE